MYPEDMLLKLQKYPVYPIFKCKLHVAAMYPFRNNDCSHGTHSNQLLKGSESQNNGPGLILKSCFKS